MPSPAEFKEAFGFLQLHFWILGPDFLKMFFKIFLSNGSDQILDSAFKKL